MNDAIEINSTSDLLKEIDNQSCLNNEASNEKEIEDIVRGIKAIDEDLEFLKNLKKKRVEPIDEKVKELDCKRKNLEELTLKSMENLFPNKKTIDFPGVAKVTRKNTKGSWKILDEDDFIDFIEKYNDQKAKDVIKYNKKVDKREATKLVESIKENDSNIEIPGTEYTEEKQSISLSKYK